MSEILNVIQNASPALAAAIIGLIYAVRGQKKEIEELKKRVDDYDALKLSESLARIQTDLEWIKRKLEEERWKGFLSGLGFSRSSAKSLGLSTLTESGGG